MNVTQTQFKTLYHIINGKDFSAFDYSTRKLYDFGTIQQKATTDLLQLHADIAFSAKTRGDHPDKF